MNRIQHTPVWTGIIMLLAVFVTSCSNSMNLTRTKDFEASPNTNKPAETVAIVSPHSLAGSNSKFLGNIIGYPSNIPANFDDYWSQVTPENAGKWGALEPSHGNWNWGPLDQIYNYAQSHGIIFKEHTFVWGNQEPDWIDNLGEAAQRGALEYFIKTFFQRYPNTAMVDVVNEPLHNPPSYADALGGSGSTGWDWVIEAFEIAQQYNNGAKLLINEYGIISDPNAARQYVEIINLLNERGLIDGVGIQCHSFSMDNVSTSTMNQVLDMLAQTGLPIYVTELDISGSDSQQKTRYATKFPVLWENPNVRGVTLWGYRQGHMWQDDAYLLRSDGSERPAFQWLRSYLNNNTDGGNPDDGKYFTI